jgi:SAM-dependent methyltransferase
VVEFLAGDGIGLAGQEIADVGCGDGIIDLGVALETAPARLVGFDVVPTDAQELLEIARREGMADELPETLEFRRSEPRALPADANSFDVVFSWSTFEHVAEPTALLRDVHRVLRPNGVLMIQIWPFFHSQHGSHLWQYFPEGFVQLLHSQEEIEAAVRADPGPEPDWAERLLDEARSCNRITLDGLQGAFLEAGFSVGKLELLTEPVHLPAGLERVPLSLLGISGVKLLASPRPSG